jgi:hypothetical protein
VEFGIAPTPQGVENERFMMSTQGLLEFLATIGVLLGTLWAL